MYCGVEYIRVSDVRGVDFCPAFEFSLPLSFILCTFPFPFPFPCPFPDPYPPLSRPETAAGGSHHPTEYTRAGAQHRVEPSKGGDRPQAHCVRGTQVVSWSRSSTPCISWC